MALQFSRVLLVGDSHADVMWWRYVVAPTAERLDVDAIVQLGDFGRRPRRCVVMSRRSCRLGHLGSTVPVGPAVSVVIGVAPV